MVTFACLGEHQTVIGSMRLSEQMMQRNWITVRGSGGFDPQPLGGAVVSGETQSESGRLSPELARVLEQACDRFEAAWQAGPEPRLEDYLSAVPPALRPALLRELILLDIHYRQSCGQACSAAMYRERFPEMSEAWLGSALAEPPRGDQASALREQPQETGAGHEPGMAQTTAYQPEGLGGRIGPYKLLQKLGEGGMGTVYVAQQEKPVARRVALKIIKAGMDSAQVIARFEQERQALALMDHPNIAKVLDAGTTEGGRPFFVMELVKGIPVTKFCDLEHLTPRERLDLFIPICHAVQHAHQKGIIHRDLKPSNVIIALYDGKPVPKIIDFGVAKATSQKLTEKTVFTEVGQMVGTLEYMAPEQAELNNLDIDTRADIYALGVLLYELLTGSPPFTGKELRSVAFAEMLRMIREVEPQKPSTKLSSSDQLASIAAMRKVEPARLTKLLAGDLDWIVMKALDKERGRRYDTANGLALDILRYLHDEPVLASPPGAGYRLRKFVRRHPGQIALATVSLVAALAVVGVVVAQSYNARLAAINAKLAETSDQLQESLLNAKAANAKARHYLYLSQMTLVERARQEGQIGRVLQLLRSVIPEGREEEDLRGFEWYVLWRKYNGEQSRLSGHAGPVTAVAFSPDDRLLASGSSDSKISLWDHVAGKTWITLSGHSGRVTALAFSPDGKQLLSASTDQTVKLWDTGTGKELLSMSAHKASVLCVACCPDGRHAASGSEDGIGLLWDMQTGGTVMVFRTELVPTETAVAVFGLAFSPDGKTLATVTKSFENRPEKTLGETTLWETFTGKPRARLETKQTSTCVAFSPDGKLLATTKVQPPAQGKLPAYLVQIWDLTSHQARPMEGHTDVITALAFSQNGMRLVSASRDQTVRVWDVATGKESAVFHAGASVLSLAISPDGCRIAAGAEDHRIMLWTLPGSEVRDTDIGGKITGLAYSPDGLRLAAAHNRVTILNVITGGRIREFPDRAPAGISSGWFRLAWSKDGECLALPRARLVNPDTGLEGPILSNSGGASYSTAFSQDGRLFASAAGRHGPDYANARLWSRTTAGQPRSFTPFKGGFPASVAFSPDSKWLAIGGGAEQWVTLSGFLTVIDVETAKTVFVFEEGPISVWDVSFSPDGKRLAAATGYWSGSGAPGEVRIWDTATWRELYRCQGHTACVWCLSFSPDGRRLASVAGPYNGTGGEVKLWDIDTGQEVCTLQGHDKVTYSAVFSPDGRHLATGGADGIVKIWDGTPLAESPGREKGFLNP
jgi:WD40 repeat protein/serine/threonine protein kinase